ncbi:MAG: hypothetical protein M0013_07955 [Actinomycetota bacterium]|nr:hypothetical protein [Actinomycetota bacterium]
MSPRDHDRDHDRRVTPPTDTHEWVSFVDPDEDRTWMFDVTFLESPWTCIFGRGCQGVLTGPAAERNQGCCSYGAHFTDADDVRRVEQAAAELTPGQWQYHGRRARGAGASAVVRTTRSGQQATRLVADACIFLNRPGFAGGAGCALHLAALERNVPPLALKPDVCWQLPLRREDHSDDAGHVTTIVRQWDRRDWGSGGGDFHWWCTESPEAFVGHHPVYRELHDELIALVGEPVHTLLCAALDARAASGSARPSARSGHGANRPRTVTALPHPAVRRR